jgi:hypothetical protein
MTEWSIMRIADKPLAELAALDAGARESR